jgi:hypothetical protein
MQFLRPPTRRLIVKRDRATVPDGSGKRNTEAQSFLFHPANAALIERAIGEQGVTAECNLIPEELVLRTLTERTERGDTTLGEFFRVAASVQGRVEATG